MGKMERTSKKWCFEESGHSLVFCKDDAGLATFFSAMHNETQLIQILLFRSLVPMIHFRSLIPKSQDLLLVRKLSLKR